MRLPCWRIAWLISSVLAAIYTALVLPVQASTSDVPAWATTVAILGLQLVIAGYIYIAIDTWADRRRARTCEG